jgi:hypothetical protein
MVCDLRTSVTIIYAKKREGLLLAIDSCTICKCSWPQSRCWYIDHCLRESILKHGSTILHHTDAVWQAKGFTTWLCLDSMPHSMCPALVRAEYRGLRRITFHILAEDI